MALRSKNEPLEGELIVQGFTGAGVLESDARMAEESRIEISDEVGIVRIVREETW